MLGLVRFILAVLVLIMHFPYVYADYTFGMVAVFCFYFISGFFMKHSYGRFAQHSARPIVDFYMDRFIKLFPQYWLVVIVAFASIAIGGDSVLMPLMNQDISVAKVLLNLTLLPTNYVFPPLIIEALKPHPIVVPAWSLATEFHFYLLLPVIFILAKRWWLALLISTMLIQFGSIWLAAGTVYAYVFSYRYIFGVLTLFLFGYAFAARDQGFYRRVCWFIWLMFALFLFAIGPLFIFPRDIAIRTVFIGGFVALPLAYLGAALKPTPLFKKVDKWLGSLAYPMFISHYLCFYWAEKLLQEKAGSALLFGVVSMVLCFVTSLGLAVFQQYFEAYRIRRRGFVSFQTRFVDAGATKPAA